MTSFQIGSQLLKRTAILATIAASLVVAIPDGANAEGDSSQNGTTQVQVCEAMGGEVDVYTDRASDHLTVIVECNGGYLDGLNCINDTDASGSFTECTQTRLVSYDEVVVVGGVQDIQPLEEPVKEPVGGAVGGVDTIAPPIEQAPESDDSTVQPTPEPVVDDGAVADEPIVSDGDGATAEPTEEAGGGIVLIDDGAVAPGVDESMSSGDESTDIFLELEPIQIDGLPFR
jgi:hypothetical protein